MTYADFSLCKGSQLAEGRTGSSYGCPRAVTTPSKGNALMEKHSKQDFHAGFPRCLYYKEESLGSGQETCPVKQLPIVGQNSE